MVVKGYRCVECGTFFPNKEELNKAVEECRKTRKGCNTLHTTIEEIFGEDLII